MVHVQTLSTSYFLAGPNQHNDRNIAVQQDNLLDYREPFASIVSSCLDRKRNSSHGTYFFGFYCISWVSRTGFTSTPIPLPKAHEGKPSLVAKDCPHQRWPPTSPGAARGGGLWTGGGSRPAKRDSKRAMHLTTQWKYKFHPIPSNQSLATVSSVKSKTFTVRGASGTCMTKCDRKHSISRCKILYVI